MLFFSPFLSLTQVGPSDASIHSLYFDFLFRSVQLPLVLRLRETLCRNLRIAKRKDEGCEARKRLAGQDEHTSHSPPLRTPRKIAAHSCSTDLLLLSASSTSALLLPVLVLRLRTPDLRLLSRSRSYLRPRRPPWPPCRPSRRPQLYAQRCKHLTLSPRLASGSSSQSSVCTSLSFSCLLRSSASLL